MDIAPKIVLYTEVVKRLQVRRIATHEKWMDGLNHMTPEQLTVLEKEGLAWERKLTHYKAKLAKWVELRFQGSEGEPLARHQAPS